MRNLDETKYADDGSREIIRSIKFRSSEIEVIDSMKRTEGWKVMDKKIREEVKIRIAELIKDDARLMTLIELLKVADTKTQAKILQQEIDSFLPEE